MMTEAEARERAEQIAGEGNYRWSTAEWADVLTTALLAVQAEALALPVTDETVEAAGNELMRTFAEHRKTAALMTLQPKTVRDAMRAALEAALKVWRE